MWSRGQELDPLTASTLATTTGLFSGTREWGVVPHLQVTDRIVIVMSTGVNAAAAIVTTTTETVTPDVITA